MYGDVLLYFPALLRICGLSLQMAYKAFVVAMTAFTCLICYWCLKRMLLAGGDLRPRREDLRISLAFVAIYLAVVYPLNNALDTNFAFVSTPADGSPLVAVASVFGNPGYLVPYAAALVGSFVAMLRSLRSSYSSCVVEYSQSR